MKLLWKHRTRTGKVVYPSKKSTFRPGDVARVLLNITVGTADDAAAIAVCGWLCEILLESWEGQYSEGFGMLSTTPTIPRQLLANSMTRFATSWRVLHPDITIEIDNFITGWQAWAAIHVINEIKTSIPTG